MDDTVISFPGATVQTVAEHLPIANRGYAFRDLEGAVCDLDRLARLNFRMVLEACQSPEDQDLGGMATVLAEILRDKVRDFKAAYLAAYQGGE